jgi:2,3-diketo-5-methylthio-1-phosphopentane phosphatase
MENDESKKILVIFDLDNTILCETTDYKLFSLLREEKLKEAQSPCNNWAHHMQKIYLTMKEDSITIEEIKKVVQSIPLMEGFSEIFELISRNKNKFETLIVSGANTLYIEWIIDYHKLHNIIDGYYSNIAQPHDDLLIKIVPNHSHDCRTCEVDQAQCKKKVLHDFFKIRGVDYQRDYSNILYIGDGENDYCPSTLLDQKNHLFPREEYALHKMLSDEKIKTKLECNIHPWKNGFNIIEVINKLL